MHAETEVISHDTSKSSCGYGSFSFALAIILISVPSRGQEQKSITNKTQRRPFDENRFPIADYDAVEPTDPVQRAKRQAKGKKYDKSSWRVYPNSVSDSMIRVDYVDRNLPPFPFDKSSVVAVGQVSNAQAYLSNDKTGVYSVFTIQVNEVLKNSTNIDLSDGSVIEVERDGGRVRFPNGRLHLYKVDEQDMPQVGLRYVLFLTNPSGESDLHIITGYELREGKVYSLDDLPKLRAYDNTDETTFLMELRSKAKQQRS
jgi:hypothetical protein